MTNILNLDNIFNNPVLTMGTFDGVHLGHQKLLREVKKRADEIDGESVVLTYYHHPLETINLVTYPYLLTERHRKECLIKSCGIDHVLYMNFDQKMSKMLPEDFIRNLMVGEIGAKEIVFGYDTHFGYKRKGNFDLLKQLETKLGYKADLVSPYRVDDTIVSSSLIREYVRQGNVNKVAQFLGRNYCLEGTVVSGHKIGRELGFPTINLAPIDRYKLIPLSGVYFSKVKTENGEFWGVSNVGYSPTVKDINLQEIETFILDFSDEIYGQRVLLEFISRIRDEIKFPSKKDLIEAIRNDVDTARMLIKESENV